MQQSVVGKGLIFASVLTSTLAFVASCGPGGTQVIPPADTTVVKAPGFVAVPHVAAVGPSDASIAFSLDKPGLVFSSLIPHTALALTPDQLADDVAGNHWHLRTPCQPQEMQHIDLTDLQPDTEYFAYFVAKDFDGRLQETSTEVPFKTAALPQTAAIISGAPSDAQEGGAWSFQPVVFPLDTPLELIEAPAFLSWNADSRTVSGVPTRDDSGSGAFTFKLRSTDSKRPGERGFRVALHIDPLARYAWHLGNRGQGFSWLGGISGHDLHLEGALARGLTGAGIKLRLVDTGLQVAHPDLKDNVDLENNINFEPQSRRDCKICNPKDVSPIIETGSVGDPGTAVAGIIAASGRNGLGLRGIAPHVKISGANLVSPRVTPSNIFYQQQLRNNVDIVVQNFSVRGAALEHNEELDNFYETLQTSAINGGRDGKGLVFIKAAGDNRAVSDNANFDAHATLPYLMVAAAYSADGNRASYSNSGSNLWISAPGGERGFQSDPTRIPPAIRTRKDDFLPGILTTNISVPDKPCTAGYAKRPQFFMHSATGAEFASDVHALGTSSGFELGWHSLNKNCDYTAAFYGTGAAAGMVGGVTALLLEANPSLTWRDVKHVLAATARRIDPTDGPVDVEVSNKPLRVDAGWSENKGGWFFSNSYGFGAIDTDKALALADPLTYRPLSKLQQTAWRVVAQPASIPINSVSGVSQYVSMPWDMIAETVQVKINLIHPDVSHLHIILTSPSGTESILLALGQAAKHADFHSMVFLSNAFYGELVTGDWHVTVVDGKGGDTTGKLTSWSMRIMGHK